MQQTQQQAAVRTVQIEGIDVSKYQGRIDWPRVNLAKKRFAIVRTGWGGYAGGIEEGYDPRFVENITGARAAGLGVGAYLYSYMNTTAAAHAAAESMMRLVRPFQPDYPVVLDLEDASTYAPLGRNKTTAIAKTFLEDLEAGGYYAMLYTYTNFANTYLDMNALRAYDLWIADYRAQVGYSGRYGIWQYTSSGRVSGISGAVDLDRAFQDYPAIIRRAKLNHLGEAAPVMEALSGAELEVFGTKNCQFFTAPDVWQVAGSLANGRYKAIARSRAPFDGFLWVMLLMGGSVWWTALLEDRCRLIGGGAASRSALWEEERYLDELVGYYRQENALLRGRLDTAEARLEEIRALARPTRDSDAAGAQQPKTDGEDAQETDEDAPQSED